MTPLPHPDLTGEISREALEKAYRVLWAENQGLRWKACARATGSPNFNRGVVNSTRVD